MAGEGDLAVQSIKVKSGHTDDRRQQFLKVAERRKGSATLVVAKLDRLSHPYSISA